MLRCALIAFLIGTAAPLSAVEPAYVIMTIMGPDAMGSSVGKDEAAWNREEQDEVSNIRGEFGAQPAGRDRYVGFSVALTPTLNLDPGHLKAQVTLALDLAERNDLPVFFHLDDQHFWWRSPELSRNPDMTEWSDFPKPGEKSGPAVPRYWLPWGDPPSVFPAPPPCLACPAFRAEMARRLRDDVAATIAQRFKKWQGQGRGYLFAGVASGNETQVPDFRVSARAGWPASGQGRDTTGARPVNVPMTEADMVPTGYHSLHALGCDRAALEKLARERGIGPERVVEQLFDGLAHDYAEFQDKTLVEAGLPAERIYTHFTSSSRSTGMEPERKPEPSGRFGAGPQSPPIAASVNRYSRPGFTVVRGGVNLDELVAQLSRAGAPEGGRAWAAVESYATTGQPGVPQTQEQYEEYLGGLLAHGAKVVGVYGWNIPWIARSPYRLKGSGVIPAVKKWLSGAALSAQWSGADIQARLASIRAKMAALQDDARRAHDAGHSAREITHVISRFQRDFEPLMRADRLIEAEAVLDRAAAELQKR